MIMIKDDDENVMETNDNEDKNISNIQKQMSSLKT